MKTPIQFRDPSLSSKAARDALDHSLEPVFDRVFTTIDNLRHLYDGLAAVRANADPLKTREAHALDYKRKFDGAKEQADTLLRNTVKVLVDYEAKLIADAHAKAGIDKRPPLAEHIWTTLRGMDQKDRDGAVLEAINRGDRVVIAAILHCPSPMLTGSFTVPLETTMQHFLAEQVPDLDQQKEDVMTALNFLNAAAGGFRVGSDKLRDLPAEERAEQGTAASKAADAALAEAMRGTKPAAAQID